MSLLPGVFQLPQDLRLTQHQRIEPTGHAHQVSGCIFTLVVIEMAIQFACGDVIDPVNPVDKSLLAGFGRKTVNFRAIAGA